MGSSSTETENNHGSRLIYDVKLSSVVPASITAEDKQNHQLTSMDLIMKLHYIKSVHFFEKDAVEGLRIHELKNAMFGWLEIYYPICGRIRWSDGGGKAYIKCNDSGVRVVEAKCGKTVEEWRLGSEDDFSLLVYNQPLAHDFGFTPLVFIQLTKFECGGMSVGMSWSHLLGDAFSALNCINSLWDINNSKSNTKQQQSIKNQKNPNTTSFCKSLKLLDPLGENWLIPNNHKMMLNHSFQITKDILSNYITAAITDDEDDDSIKPFELISAIIWKLLAKIRGIDKEPNTITICKFGETRRNQIIGVVEVPATDFRVSEADSVELAKLIAGNFVDESDLIMEVGEKDFMVYGVNLTFVDLGEVNLYGMEVERCRRPCFANVSIGGVGEQGAVVVVPGNDGGKIVNVILPEDELPDFKKELKLEMGVF